MIGVLLMLVVVATQSAWPPQGEVVSSFDKAADFSSVRTFAWERGLELADKDAHELLVATIEGELVARGMRAAADRESADVIVRYDAVGTGTVDLEKLQQQIKTNPDSVPPTKVMGSLVVSTHRNRSPNIMWRSHLRDLVDLDPRVREKTVKSIVARVFTTYPLKPKA
jgi:hypothetical protein